MRIPIIRGLIDRRILINYRVDPGILAANLPAPFRPKMVNGYGIAGICLIRLKHVRPAVLPSWIGIASENAAHRVAVEWDDAGKLHEGVYVERRDTNSRLNALAGGRIFPGIHHHAQFDVSESAERFSVAMNSDDGVTSMSVQAQSANGLPESSIFASVEEVSDFFEAGSLGYSTTPEPSRFQGLELRCFNWQVEPLSVQKVQSSYFGDALRFPQGSIELDCALLMRGILHEWRGREDLCCLRAS